MKNQCIREIIYDEKFIEFVKASGLKLLQFDRSKMLEISTLLHLLFLYRKQNVEKIIFRNLKPPKIHRAY